MFRTFSLLGLTALLAVSTFAQEAGTSGKKTVAIANFAWDTVHAEWYHSFGSEEQIGKSIRNRLTTRLVQRKIVTVVEREELQKLIDEQNANMSGRFKAGQGPRASRVSGADAYLLGGITIFGRDDKTSEGAFGGLGKLGPFDFTKLWQHDAKMVVEIDYRLVNAETGETLDAGEARGESSRSSRKWADVIKVPGVKAAGATSVQSTNFERTIIGEATMDCVEKLAAMLNTNAASLGGRTAAEIQAKVAQVDGDSLTINAGSNHGVQRGMVLIVEENLGDIPDPDTGKIIGTRSRPIGTLVINSVQPDMATGKFTPDFTGAVPKIKSLAHSR